MNIDTSWHIEDEETGLRISVIEGEELNRLHIEFPHNGNMRNRDFWFTKDGEFDGTGTQRPID